MSRRKIRAQGLEVRVLPRRAKKHRNLRPGRGVNAARMTAVGWGQTKPVADNSTEEGRAKNRRVEVVKK
jgi:outer membrane protein OmpA-like peptidoglycan-associated protein